VQTKIPPERMTEPAFVASEKILRTCVHCGFCTATCPTYVLLGDELDSPRGRIYLIKDMLENPDKPVPATTVTHIDRCLSCLSCMTTCPSGVNYMHLVDHGRAHIEEHYRRPILQRVTRSLLALILPRPRLFRFVLTGAQILKPLAAYLPPKLSRMMSLVPTKAKHDRARQVVSPAEGTRRYRVALLSGCVQPVLDPEINAATVRLLNRHGVEVIQSADAGCCGALAHHLGKSNASHEAARRNIAAWTREIEADSLDAIVITASGCGTTIKDYGFMFRSDPEWSQAAAKISSLAKDITEFLAAIGLQAPVTATGLRVAYHSACSMQHGQRISRPPRELLAQAGFNIQEIPEGHLCCGSAGTYNLLQPDIAKQLLERKVAHIEGISPDVVATGNIGCITQLQTGTAVPVLHTVQLLDWATGGPRPDRLPAARLRR